MSILTVDGFKNVVGDGFTTTAAAGAAPTPQLANMRKSDIVNYAVENNLDVDTSLNKDELISAIENL